jgi:hypothetical protein
MAPGHWVVQRSSRDGLLKPLLAPNHQNRHNIIAAPHSGKDLIAELIRPRDLTQPGQTTPTAAAAEATLDVLMDETLFLMHDLLLR